MRTKSNIVNRLVAALAESKEFVVGGDQVFALFNSLSAHILFVSSTQAKLIMTAKKDGEIIFEETFYLADGDVAALGGFEGRIKIDLSAS